MAEGLRAVRLIAHIWHLHYSRAKVLHHAVHLLSHLLKGVHWTITITLVAIVPSSSIVDGFESTAEWAAKTPHHRVHGISVVGEEGIIVEKASSKHFFFRV